MNSWYTTNMEQTTKDNTSYRKVLYTTPTQQLVVMNLHSGEKIDGEIHPYTTQFIRVEDGQCKVTIGESKTNVMLISGSNDTIIIPPNTYHEVLNTGNANLKLYTIYSLPEHPDLLEQKIKPNESKCVTLDEIDKLTNTNNIKDLYIKLKSIIDKDAK